MEHTEKQVFSYADISASFWTYKLFPMNVILWFFFPLLISTQKACFLFFSPHPSVVAFFDISLSPAIV